MIEAYPTVVNYLPQLDRKETKTYSKPDVRPIDSSKMTERAKNKAKSGGGGTVLLKRARGENINKKKQRKNNNKKTAATKNAKEKGK